jgi:hypothetical protein
VAALKTGPENEGRAVRSAFHRGAPRAMTGRAPRERLRLSRVSKSKQSTEKNYFFFAFFAVFFAFFAAFFAFFAAMVFFPFLLALAVVALGLGFLVTVRFAGLAF